MKKKRVPRVGGLLTQRPNFPHDYSDRDRIVSREDAATWENGKRRKDERPRRAHSSVRDIIKDRQFYVRSLAIYIIENAKM